MLLIPFETFKEEAANRGYVARFEPSCKNHKMEIRSKNSVTVQLKNIKRYGGLVVVMGYGRSPEEIAALTATIKEDGHELVHESAAGIKVKFTDFEQFYYFVDLIENIDDIVAKSRGLSRKLFKTVYDTHLIAKRYFFAIENQDQVLLDLARDLLSADKFDRDIAINTPTEERTYREHIVPCIAIHNEVIDRILAGADINSIAAFIKDNLKIAYIKPSDAEYIDVTLGLRTCMPEGWNWGDSIVARLTEGNVVYQ